MWGHMYVVSSLVRLLKKSLLFVIARNEVGGVTHKLIKGKIKTAGRHSDVIVKICNYSYCKHY